MQEQVKKEAEKNPKQNTPYMIALMEKRKKLAEKEKPKEVK